MKIMLLLNYLLGIAYVSLFKWPIKKKNPPFKEKNKGVNCSSFQNFLVREENKKNLFPNQMTSQVLLAAELFLTAVLNLWVMAPGGRVK